MGCDSGTKAGRTIQSRGFLLCGREYLHYYRRAKVVQFCTSIICAASVLLCQLMGPRCGPPGLVRGGPGGFPFDPLLSQLRGLPAPRKLRALVDCCTTANLASQRS
jgi:hypothetical protein